MLKYIKNVLTKANFLPSVCPVLNVPSKQSNSKDYC